MHSASEQGLTRAGPPDFRGISKVLSLDLVLACYRKCVYILDFNNKYGRTHA